MIDYAQIIRDRAQLERNVDTQMRLYEAAEAFDMMLTTLESALDFVPTHHATMLEEIGAAVAKAKGV